MIKVSIIIPVFKVEQYIKRCICSILAQESADCDIECVVVDDCTPDDSMKIIDDIVTNYNGKINFVFCTHNVNKGLSEARNTGIRNATGDFILFVDSDDCLSDDCLKLMIGGLESYPNVDVVLGNAFSCKYGRPFFPPVSAPTLLTNKNEILLKVFFADLHFHAWNRLVRRDLIVNNDLYFVEGLLYEDMPWTYKLITVVSSMLVLPNNTYVYEYNENSIMNTTEAKINKVVYSFCYIINYILDNKLKEIRSDCRIYCFGILLRTVDMVSQFSCSDEMGRSLHKVKIRLFKETLCSGRLLLSLFFVTGFKPIVNIYKIPVVRNQYHRMTVIYGRIERFLDRII